MERARNPDEQKGLTKEEALTWLSAWRDYNIPKYHLRFSMMNKFSYTSGVQNVYLTELINELSRRIRNSEDDPITTVAKYYSAMDDILAMSDDDHFITHRFARYMEFASHEVLMFLKEKEKEMRQR